MTPEKTNRYSAILLGIGYGMLTLTSIIGNDMFGISLITLSNIIIAVGHLIYAFGY